MVSLLLLCNKASPKGNDIKESNHFMMIFYDLKNGPGSARCFSPRGLICFYGEMIVEVGFTTKPPFFSYLEVHAGCHLKPPLELLAGTSPGNLFI